MASRCVPSGRMGVMEPRHQTLLNCSYITHLKGKRKVYLHLSVSSDESLTIRFFVYILTHCLLFPVDQNEPDLQ